MRIVELPDVDGPKLTVRLREPIGQDELTVAAADPSAAVALVGRLASDVEGTPLNLAGLSVSRCDRLMAALYDALYGGRAECRVRCAACGDAYEFTLHLPELIAMQDAARPDPPDAAGAWVLPDGRRVRAPLLSDLAAVDRPAALLARLVVSGDPSSEPQAVIGFLERAAPTLTLDLDAPCPHCQRTQTVRFDLGRYLTQRLAGERAFLLRETHLIAARYGWSYTEIIGLTREDRRAYAGLIEAERANLARRRVG